MLAGMTVRTKSIQSNTCIWQKLVGDAGGVVGDVEDVEEEPDEKEDGMDEMGEDDEDVNIREGEMMTTMTTLAANRLYNR